MISPGSAFSQLTTWSVAAASLGSDHYFCPQALLPGAGVPLSGCRQVTLLAWISRSGMKRMEGRPAGFRDDCPCLGQIAVLIAVLQLVGVSVLAGMVCSPRRGRSCATAGGADCSEHAQGGRDGLHKGRPVKGTQMVHTDQLEQLADAALLPPVPQLQVMEAGQHAPFVCPSLACSCAASPCPLAQAPLPAGGWGCSKHALVHRGRQGTQEVQLGSSASHTCSASLQGAQHRSRHVQVDGRRLSKGWPVKGTQAVYALGA